MNNRYFSKILRYRLCENNKYPVLDVLEQYIFVQHRHVEDTKKLMHDSL